MSDNKYEKINNFFDIISSIIFCGVENQTKEIVKEYRNITILNNDIDSTDFSINREVKIKSIKDGYDQTYIFFKKNM